MGSESGAARLEIRDELTRPEVRTAIKRHVLDEVCKPLLVVGLVQRSCFDREPQGDALRGQRVAADVEPQAILERAGPDGSVKPNDFVRSKLRRSRRRLRAGCSRRQDSDGGHDGADHRPEAAHT